MLVALLAGPPVASAQSAATTFPSLTMQGPAEQAGTNIIKDAYGKPCLDVEAAARAETINREMRDHVVSVKNNCPRLIRATVCYYQTDRCNDLIIHGYQRVDTILGAMRGVNSFRYSIQTK
jgi:hypothetical protein